MQNTKNTTNDLCELLESVGKGEIRLDAKGNFRKLGGIYRESERILEEDYNHFINNPLKTLMEGTTYFLIDPIRIYHLTKCLLINL